MSVKPEDLLPDEQNFLEVNGQIIRKGTMGAALANAKIVDSADATLCDKQEAMIALKELVPALSAFGLTEFLTWKNSDIQSLFEI